MGYGVAIAVLALFALFTPSRIVRYVSLAWIAVPALSWLYSRLTIPFVTVTRESDVLRGQKRESLILTLNVSNRSLLPLPYVLVRDTIGPLTARSPGQFVVPLGAQETRRLSHEVMGQRIGAYEVGPVEIEGSDPLGLFPWRRVFRTPCRLIIYPNVHVVMLDHPAGLPAGDLGSKNRIYEDVTQFRSHREYTAGDEIRRINWKITARMGKLFSTEFQPTLYYPVLILLNLSEDDYPMRARDQLAERACETAASLVSFAAGMRQEVGLVTTGAPVVVPQSAEIGGGYGHALSLLEMISCTALAPGHADYRVALLASRPPVGARLMVVGPPPTPEQGQALAAARRRRVTVEHFQILPSDAAMERPDLKTYRVLEYGESLLDA